MGTDGQAREAAAGNRDQRRDAAERDALIYATAPPDPELDAWSAWAAANPPALDD